jgi:hypothetical protein
MKFKRQNIGTVSHGTMRPGDLIPAFCYELRQQTPLRRHHKTVVCQIEKRAKRKDYYTNPDSGADFDMDTLFDLLNEYAPAYFYFGSHPGDGSDYGFWLDEDGLENIDGDARFDSYQYDDLASVPRGYTGEAVIVNDHGNATLYRITNGRAREVWAIV